MAGGQGKNTTAAPWVELPIGLLPEPPSELASAVFLTHMLDGSRLMRLFTNPTDSKNGAFLEEQSWSVCIQTQQRRFQYG
jgi:hypothetical protein